MFNNLLLKKISVFAAPLGVLILWEIWLHYERAVIEIGILTLALVGAVVWYLTLRPVAVAQLQTSFHRKEFWRFFITPALAVVAVYLFLLIIEDHFWQQFLVVVANLLAVVLLQNIFDRFYHSAHYPANSFASISGHINNISLFLLVTVFYSWSTFLNLAVWQLAILLLVVTTLLVYETMWISGLEIKKSWLYVLVINVIVVEIFWVLAFLPNTFYVKALVVTIVYYLSVNLSRNYLVEVLDKKMVWRYLVVGGIIMALVLGTAQWL